MPSPHEIARALLDTNAVLLQPDQPFTFASGLRSPVYCDTRLLLGNVAARRLVSDGLAAHCDGAAVIAGPATGGIAWAAWASERLDLPMTYVRSSAKGYGRGQQIEGAAVAGQPVVVLEDTVSTGESVLHAAAALRDAGAELVRCVCIFTWGWEATAQSFAEVGLELQPLATLADLLDVVAETGAISREQRTAVEAWAADPKGWQG